MDHVVDQYSDLLSPSELDFHKHFIHLGSDAQKLLVRMLMRKGHFFRSDKLNYREITDTRKAAGELKSSGLIDINPLTEIENLLPLFSKNEWLEKLRKIEAFSSVLPELRKLKRGEFDRALTTCPDFAINLTWLEQDIYQLTAPAIFDVFKLLFFGNLTQDLTEFVLNDLGLYRYESYHIDRSARLFSNRRQIEKHIEYYLLRDLLEDCLEAGSEFILELHTLLPTPDPEDKALCRRVQKIHLKMARQLERLECLDQALEIYQHCQYPPARERRARIFAKQNRLDDAIAVCEEIIKDPADEEELFFAGSFGKRITRKCQRQWHEPVIYQPESETLVLDINDTVELAVAKYFSNQGDCHYVENALFCSLFGLHYWDVIFAPVRGAFSHPFQSRPHDLHESDFVRLRAGLFAAAQAHLLTFRERTDHYLQLWRDKYGTLTPFVYWGALNESIIATAIERIPRNHWEKVFERLWRDLKANSSGFPDLIHFPATGGYELIEVKGPGDRLQKNQLRWMQYFSEHGIPHKVVQVEWRK